MIDVKLDPDTENLPIRDGLAYFVKEMERVLAENDDEKGDSWRRLPLDTFLVRIVSNALTLMKMPNAKDAVDIANYALFYYTKLGGEGK